MTQQKQLEALAERWHKRGWEIHHNCLKEITALIQEARVDELKALESGEIANQSLYKMQIRIKGRIRELSGGSNNEHK